MAIGFWLALARVGGLRVSLRGLPRLALVAAVSIGVARLIGLTSLPSALIGETLFVVLLSLSGGVPEEVRLLLPDRRSGRP
jgi:hypothetical protein